VGRWDTGFRRYECETCVPYLDIVSCKESHQRPTIWSGPLQIAESIVEARYNGSFVSGWDICRAHEFCECGAVF